MPTFRQWFLQLPVSTTSNCSAQITGLSISNTTAKQNPVDSMPVQTGSVSACLGWEGINWKIAWLLFHPLGSNNVSICASLGTHAYLCVQQKVCWHTSPMRTIIMLHSSMLTCITHVCSRSYISHVGMLEHSILIAPMGQHTRGFQEQNYYVMYFIKFTWFQLQNKMFHISLHTWIRPHITGWCKSA